MNWRCILMYPKQVMFFTCLIYPLISKSNKALECVSLFFFLLCKAWSWHNQINQRVPQANLWIIIYCILEMKADNKPAISLPVYFKSVKTENMFFDKKKNKFPTVGVESRTFFFLSREVELHNIGATSIIMWVHERRTTINLKYTKRKRHKKRIRQAAICQLRMILLSKIPPFYTWVCDSCQ